MSHRSLRLGALMLIAAMAIWPRARSRTATAELATTPAAHVSAASTASPAPAAAATPPVSVPPPAAIVATNEDPYLAD